MSLFVFKDKYLEFFGTKYFVANAPQMTLGSYGDKADSAFTAGKLEPKDHLPAPKLDGKVKAIGPISLDAKSSNKSDFKTAVSGSIKVVGFDGSVGSTYEALVKQELAVVQLIVEENDIRDAINASPKAMANLRDYGGDARVVHSVFVVAEARWAESFSHGSKFSVGANAAGIVSVTASGGGLAAGGSKLTLDPGMVLAYGMLKLDWNKGKTAVDGTRVDEVGMR
jgi:Gasdermin pore forming domain